MIVIDATAAVELVLMTERGVSVADRIFGGEETVHAPDLLDLEVAQVLRKLVPGGEISSERADRAFSDLTNLSVMRHGHRPLRSRVWRLRENFSAYDAAYVALAEALDASLITFDQRLIRAAVALVDVEFT
ncbi:MAG: type II toxin-antitoxin system VapC family toxin [Thermoanaerobaculia bacterium]|nr:type II toxin-antitoxin system VapC family toxin [Thermoanaerobaculia bacterium]